MVYSRASCFFNHRKDQFFSSLLLQATSGVFNVGAESEGNIQECSYIEMCLEHLPLLFILPRRFNKSIFVEVFRHESIQENPIGIRVPCVHAWISNIPFFLHFAISWEYDVVCMSGHGCHLLIYWKIQA